MNRLICKKEIGEVKKQCLGYLQQLTYTYTHILTPLCEQCCLHAK
jgi:hypothetical protein